MSLGVSFVECEGRGKRMRLRILSLGLIEIRNYKDEEREKVRLVNEIRNGV